MSPDTAVVYKQLLLWQLVIFSLFLNNHTHFCALRQENMSEIENRKF